MGQGSVVTEETGCVIESAVVEEVFGSFTQ